MRYLLITVVLIAVLAFYSFKETNNQMQGAASQAMEELKQDATGLEQDNSAQNTLNMVKSLAQHVSNQAESTQAQSMGLLPENGRFEAIRLPDGIPADGVVIFTPKNSSSDINQRAELLASNLSRRNIPYVHSSSTRFTESPNSTAFSMERATEIIESAPLPLVYVNGKVSGNPSSEEVIAEYQRTSHH